MAMALVKMHNKKTGVTYVYESESYWDKEKQQPRNRRKLVGKIDPATGEIVPTGKPGRKRSPPIEKDRHTSEQAVQTSSDGDFANVLSLMAEKDREITNLKEKVRTLEDKCEHYEWIMDRIRSMIGSDRC